ncbi:MAG: threonine synthase [Planctomycetaceae bacterium]|nr:threonine synthase [Planctomycetaceae bacterium]
MGQFLTHLESPWDGSRHEARTLQTTHAGRPLVARYDLERIAREVERDSTYYNAGCLWSFRDLLPVQDDRNIVSFGELATPTLQLARLGEQLGLENLFLKDESRLPTGSFKSRGMSVAISRAKELGVTRVAVPTQGNAGGAMAAYAARAGMEAWVFLPSDTPEVNKLECELAGARVVEVDGLIGDCAALLREGQKLFSWFDLSTLREPYRLEGKKTMGLELAQHFGWRFPEVVLYPTGGGTGLIGIWKAWEELSGIGWLEDPRAPRLYACQSDGCAPIARAFERGERTAEPWQGAQTLASGLRVPSAIGDFLMVDALRASGGSALGVPEASITGWMRRVGELEGVAICPETAVCFEALVRLVAQGRIQRHEEIVIFNTGAAFKYVEALRAVPRAERPRFRPGDSVDWRALAAQFERSARL